MAKPHADTMYIIFPYDELVKLSQAFQTDIIGISCETSKATMRHNLFGIDKVVLKFNKYNWKYKGGPPAILTKLAAGYDTYTYDEILEEMQTPEWSGEGKLASSSSSSEGKK